MARSRLRGRSGWGWALCTLCGGLLPALGRIGGVAHFSLTGPTACPPLVSLGRMDPAALRASDNIARRGELHVMTAASGTPQVMRLRSPDRIVSVGRPHQRMGDLMQDGVGALRAMPSAAREPRGI